MTDPTRVRVEGPVAPYARGFCAELRAQCYTLLSAANQVRVMAHLSRWLRARGIDLQHLTPARVEQFLRARRRAGYTAWLSVRGLRTLLGYLRRLGVVPEPPPAVARTALDRLVERFGNFLRRERGLSPGTVHWRQVVARRFLTGYAHRDRLELERLTAAGVAQFVLRESRTCSVGHAKGLVTALRSLLGFLFLEGRTATPLAAAAPAVAGWRVTGLPRALEPGQVIRLLRGCDRRTPVGRRDYAILILLARLGLRAGEVTGLQLDDIDWRQGEVIIRGKGQQQERLPLPHDVGEALAGYLRHARPRVPSRHVFLRGRAPQGALSRSGVTAVVQRASDRAGLHRIGAHRLRHTAATQMLQHGASLQQVAQVLRHRSLLTTAIYAKVDRCALRSLAQPWPGGER